MENVDFNELKIKVKYAFLNFLKTIPKSKMCFRIFGVFWTIYKCFECFYEIQSLFCIYEHIRKYIFGYVRKC